MGGVGSGDCRPSDNERDGITASVASCSRAIARSLRESKQAKIHEVRSHWEAEEIGHRLELHDGEIAASKRTVRSCRESTGESNTRKAIAGTAPPARGFVRS